jgi:hypothetical protein
VGVGNQAGNEIHGEVSWTAMPGVLDLGDVFELVGNREEPLAAGSIWSSRAVGDNGMIRPAKGFFR